jgi:phage shock protein B
MMLDYLTPVLIVGILFIGLPWIILHYVSTWKTASTLTTEDENLLDELHDLARRLDDRMVTIERIIQAENPNWRAIGRDPVETALEDRSERGERPGRVAEIGRSNRPVGRN